MIYLTTLVILFLLFIGCVSVGAATAHSEPLDVDRMVEAIRQVENWDGHSRGAAGERGPWQITAGVWVQFSDKPFAWADDSSLQARTETRYVMRECLYDIIQKLKTDGYVEADPYRTALIYAAGWSCFRYGRPHKPSKAKKDYAKRAANLYHDIQTP